MILCATCLGCIAGTREALEPQLLETARFYHHRRITDLRTAVRERCSVCSAAWEKVSERCNMRRELLEILDQGDSFLECNISKDDRFTMFLFYSRQVGDALELNPGKATHLCHYVEFLPSESFPDASFGLPSSLSTWSDEAWHLVSSCIENCLSKHTSCNEVESVDWYPTRLLDVAPVPLNPDRARIVLSGADKVCGLYVTLSHCWGHAEFRKLLKSNMEEMRSDFSITALPRTFREAVMVTRRLNIRYLWIDSLCIMQDDKADWLCEAVLMPKVYASAFCNIAATALSNSGEGLFRERVPTELHRQEHDLSFAAHEKDKPTERGGLRQRAYKWLWDWAFGNAKSDKTVKRFTLLQTHWLQELDRAPLNCRAWVMQERLLSRRIIHFTRRELVWECREHAACETHPHGFPAQVKTHSSFKTSRFTQSSSVDANDPLSTSFWQDFLHSYSSCKLSVPSDRLIAISGIARKLQAITGDEYVAGMWLKTLARDIVWNTVEHRHRRCAQLTLTSTYSNSFPSFSWASTPLMIRNSHSDRVKWLIRISNVQIKSQHDALSGIIQSGSLHLHGRLKTAWLRYQDIQDGAMYHWALFVSPTMRMENAVKVTNYVFLDHPDSVMQTFGKQEPVYFVPATRLGSSLCDCLLLQLVERDKSTFRRIGLARAFSVPSMHYSWVTGEEAEDFLPIDRLVAQQDDEHLLPCLSYLSDDEYSHEILLI